MQRSLDHYWLLEIIAA